MYNKIPTAGIGSKLLRLVPKVLAKRNRQVFRTLDELPKKRNKIRFFSLADLKVL